MYERRGYGCYHGQPLKSVYNGPYEVLHHHPKFVVLLVVRVNPSAWTGPSRKQGHNQLFQPYHPGAMVVQLLLAQSSAQMTEDWGEGAYVAATMRLLSPKEIRQYFE